MHLLRVISSMDPRSGGPCQGIRNSIPELEKLGCTNEVVSCDDPGASWLGKDSFPIHAVGAGRFGIAFAPALLPWLKDNIERFDAVISHGLWQWPSFASLLVVESRRKEVSTRRHPKFFVMPHGMLDPYFQRDPSRRLKAIRNSIYWHLFESRVIRSADAVLFTCDEELRLARRTFHRYRPRAEINVSYGVPAPPPFDSAMRDAFRTKCPSVGEAPYLLFLSRIHPKKGVDLLIRAYAKVASDLRRPTSDLCLPSLVIAGPGWDTDYGREMEQLIDQTNGQLDAENGKLKTENAACIHAADMLSGDAKWGAFYGCEAFILPSHQENFGIAVVEALACNKPVLISDKVNIWREIKEAGAGVVADDTEEGCAALLEEFLQHPPFGRLPLECFSNNFEIHSAGRRLASAIR